MSMSPAPPVKPVSDSMSYTENIRSTTPGHAPGIHSMFFEKTWELMLPGERTTAVPRCLRGTYWDGWLHGSILASRKCFRFYMTTTFLCTPKMLLWGGWFVLSH